MTTYEKITNQIHACQEALARCSESFQSIWQHHIFELKVMREKLTLAEAGCWYSNLTLRQMQSRIIGRQKMKI